MAWNGESEWLKRMPALGQLNVMMSDGDDVSFGNVLVSFHLGECMEALEERGIGPKGFYDESDVGGEKRCDARWAEMGGIVAAASNAMLEVEWRVHERLRRVDFGVAGSKSKESVARMWSMSIPEPVLLSWPDFGLLPCGPLRVFEFVAGLGGGSDDEKRKERRRVMEQVRSTVMGVVVGLGINCVATVVGRGDLGGMSDPEHEDDWGDEKSFGSVLSKIERIKLGSSAQEGQASSSRPRPGI